MRSGGPKLTREARVEVIEEPHFRKRMLPVTSGEFGKDIVLPCDVGGVPKPDVKWFKNGIPLSEIPNLRYSTEKSLQLDPTDSDADERPALKITYLRLEDSGMFQCTASNEAGDLVGYTWLRVKSMSCFRIYIS